MDSEQARKTKAMRDGLGSLLRAHYDGLAREPLPERWVELINCLDEKRRVRLKLGLMSAESDDDRALKARRRLI